MKTYIWPVEIRLQKDRQHLLIEFDDNTSIKLSAEYLRTHSPSAEVQGHAADQKKLVSGKADVKILEVLPQGNYAVRLVFDDMHNTGIYSWTYLQELAINFAANWQVYIEELASAGASREH
ncbi:gamma-butyrobetaine hydroxylase-like domain-containing protein [Polycladidibacter hongkongensis]|uniref:gamma-butyrobetaine hydroxylase-like domain-containing protein n=1 Tax=Polycladidibacter hongkongensis TaxID=1647556 RepID=UPI00082AC7DA|nr:DUF971 domain-containing protein [Pseudovibrio hongkongensis]